MFSLNTDDVVPTLRLIYASITTLDTIPLFSPAITPDLVLSSRCTKPTTALTESMTPLSALNPVITPEYAVGDEDIRVTPLVFDRFAFASILPLILPLLTPVRIPAYGLAVIFLSALPVKKSLLSTLL